MKNHHAAFTKFDLFQLKAALVILYMIQKAVLAEYDSQKVLDSQEAKVIVNQTTKKIKRLFARARKMGIPNKTIYALDNVAHAVAYNWYS